MPAIGPDHVKLRLMTRSPSPCARRFSAGTRTSWNVIVTFWQVRWPILSMTRYSTPGVPRSTSTALSDSRPPFAGSVRTMHRLTSAPRRSQPPALHGQCFSPFRTRVPSARSGPATSWMPAIGDGWSKFAVPPRSLTTHPPRKSVFARSTARPIHVAHCFSVPNHVSGISARPLTSRMVGKPPSTAESSSVTISVSTMLAPPPPYFAGRNDVAKPSAVAASNTGFIATKASCGSTIASARSAAGRRTSRANSRASYFSFRCRGVISKSIAIVPSSSSNRRAATGRTSR